MQNIKSLEEFLLEYEVTWDMYMEAIEITMANYHDSFRYAKKIHSVLTQNHSLNDLMQERRMINTDRMLISDKDILGMLFNAEISHQGAHKILAESNSSIINWERLHHKWLSIRGELCSSDGNLIRDIPFRKTSIILEEMNFDGNKEFNEDLI